MKLKDMPILIPVPILTKKKGFFTRYKNWLFGVRNWMLAEDWKFYLGGGRWVLVKKGFVFNGASIPKIFWAVLSPTGILLIAALIHDFAYCYGYILILNGTTGEITKFGEDKPRAYWDELFKKIAIRVNSFKAINNVSWWMLKAFGWVAWRKVKKRRKND